MVQVVYNYQKKWPKSGSMRINGQFTQEIAVPPATARRKANAFLAGHITMMAQAGRPALVLDDQPVWQVPINLHLPEQDKLSPLGALSVDTQTGEVIPPSPEEIIRIQDLAHAIAAYFAPSTTSTS